MAGRVDADGFGRGRHDWRAVQGQALQEVKAARVAGLVGDAQPYRAVGSGAKGQQRRPGQRFGPAVAFQFDASGAKGRLAGPQREIDATLDWGARQRQQAQRSGRRVVHHDGAGDQRPVAGQVDSLDRYQDRSGQIAQANPSLEGRAKRDILPRAFIEPVAQAGQPSAFLDTAG